MCFCESEPMAQTCYLIICQNYGLILEIGYFLESDTDSPGNFNPYTEVQVKTFNWKGQNSQAHNWNSGHSKVKVQLNDRAGCPDTFQITFQETAPCSLSFQKKDT